MLCVSNCCERFKQYPLVVRGVALGRNQDETRPWPTTCGRRESEQRSPADICVAALTGDCSRAAISHLTSVGFKLRHLPLTQPDRVASPTSWRGGRGSGNQDSQRESASRTLNRPTPGCVRAVGRRWRTPNACSATSSQTAPERGARWSALEQRALDICWQCRWCTVRRQDNLVLHRTGAETGARGPCNRTGWRQAGGNHQRLLADRARAVGLRGRYGLPKPETSASDDRPVRAGQRARSQPAAVTAARVPGPTRAENAGGIQGS